MTLVGRTIGHIRFESLLGVGGMGEVYRAFDEKLQRVVAVKTIRIEHRLSGTARSRFLREARILSKLANPLICQVYDLIEAAEADLLVLEFVEGVTLDHLRSDRRLAEREVLQLGAKIAEALMVAHRERIIHRDLKPANIMVLPSGAVKVLDFGIARSSSEDLVTPAVRGTEGMSQEFPLDPESTIAQFEHDPRTTSFSAALTQQGSIVGTVLYMSPEQASGEGLTEASDLFSFGIVLQELLTGKPAYPNEPISQLLMRVASNGSYPISGVDPEVARLVLGGKSTLTSALGPEDSRLRRLPRSAAAAEGCRIPGQYQRLDLRRSVGRDRAARQLRRLLAGHRRRRPRGQWRLLPALPRCHLRGRL